jgi:CheY-like chemotaxis protein
MSMDKKTLMIVDDNEDLVDVLVDDFELAGYRVIRAKSGNEAIEKLAQQPVDLVLADVRMPDGTGIDLIESIRAKSSESPLVLFMSAFSDISTPNAYGKGVSGLFTKPINFPVLLETVEQALKPKNTKWSVKPIETPTANIKIKAQSYDQILKMGGLSIGTGGAFFAIERNFPHSFDDVKFAIRFSDGDFSEFAGSGKVRWVRQSPNEGLLPGIGLEFIYLSEKSRKLVSEYIATNQPVSFIPIGEQSEAPH